ncbi:MAG: NAD(P)H-binding protein [Myxococcales bacterium]|nr:NAD(P)H-binding protein [Myxococcales bacterium]
MHLAILGGTGRTGVLLVRRALDAGHTLRVLARDAKKVTLQHQKLTVVTGDATNPADVARLVEGVDAVISALGPVKGQEEVCSRATQALLSTGVRRYVLTSGAGLDVPGDEKDLMGRVISKLIRVLSPAMVIDKEKELALLQQSSLEWTLVRPPRLVDAPATGRARIDVKAGPGSKVTRADLADFLLVCATEKRHVREAPFIAS